MTTTVVVNPGRFFNCDAVQFDGADRIDCLNSFIIDPTKLGIFSCWVRLDGGNGGSMLMLSGTDTVANDWIMARNSSNKFEIRATPVAGTALRISTSNSYTSGATWLHVLSSWNVGLAGARHLLINAVSDLVVTTFVDRDINYNLPEVNVGAYASAASLIAATAELYFAPGQYLDFSDAGNVQRFIVNGRPVSLGEDGSAPTGTRPAVYMRLPRADPAAAFVENRGTETNFVQAGTLTVASTSPSD